MALLIGIPREIKERTYKDKKTGEVKKIQVMKVEYLLSDVLEIDTETAEKYRHLMDKKVLIPIIITFIKRSKKKQSHQLIKISPYEEPTEIKEV